MEMLSTFRGDKNEFCLVVIKFKHVLSCSRFDITYALHGVNLLRYFVRGIRQL